MCLEPFSPPPLYIDTLILYGMWKLPKTNSYSSGYFFPKNTIIEGFKLHLEP
jgi:hypothetical protein